MKKIIILLDTPIIVSVESRLKAGDYTITYPNFDVVQLNQSTCVMYDEKIIAGIEGLPSIDWNGLEEEFGWVDVEKIVSEHLELNHIEASDKRVRVVSELYRKAQSLNEKKFSLEDVEKAIDMARESKLSFKFDNEGIVYKHTPEEIIQSLQQPKIFDIEIEMETINQDYRFEVGQVIQPKITNNSIKILRKI